MSITSRSSYGPEQLLIAKQLKQERLSVRQLQRDAAARGRRWVKCSCTGCGIEVPIHVEWRRPLVVCKECRARAKALRSRMPIQGWRVAGGLPSLGRRR